MSTASFIVKGRAGMAVDQSRLMKDLCTKRLLTDFCIKVGREELKCHWVVLAASSPYFRSLLMSNDGEKHIGVTEMVMEGFSVAAVRLVVDHMYHNQMRISDVEQALEVLDVATRWKMEGKLLKQLERIVTTGLTTGNCLKVRDHLLRGGHQHLVAFVDRFVYQNFKDVTNSDNFKMANLQYVLNLFDSEDLQVEDEMDVYEAAMRWVESDRQGREQHMCAVMMTVRLGLMDLKDAALIGVDLTRKYSQDLDDFIAENINYLRNKKLGHQMNGNLKSANKRRGQVVKKTLMCLGGEDDDGKPLKSVLTSDNDGRTWSPAGDMLVERSFFSATVCSDSVIVVGGVSSNNTLTKICQKYYIRTKQWTRIADLPKPRCRHSASNVRGQQLYVTGGRVTFESQDALGTVLTLRHVGDARAEWRAAPSMKQPRLNHVSCFINDALYVVGGWSDEYNLKSCEKLDINNNTWSSVAPTNYPHQAAGACTDGVHHIYVTGGYCEKGPRNLEMYDVVTDQWTVLRPPLRDVTCGLTLVHHRDKIYAVGGEDGDDKHLDVVQVLNTIANRWSVVAHLPTPRSFHATVSF